MAFKEVTVNLIRVSPVWLIQLQIKKTRLHLRHLQLQSQLILLPLCGVSLGL